MELLNIEIQRQTLEQNVAKLQQSLKHWQTWEAEYEGLKEEILGVEEELTPDHLSALAEDYQGELLNAGEIRDLVGFDKVPPRERGQIVGLIARRQEYVQRNVQTIEKQLEVAQTSLRQLDEASSTAGESLPLTEITEELDDDDNVIVSKTTRPEETQAKLMTSLRKAGLTESDLEKGAANQVAPSAGQKTVTAPEEDGNKAMDPSTTENVAKPSSADDTSIAVEDVSLHEDDATRPQRPPARKKSVSFSADTKPAPELAREDPLDGKKSVSFAGKIAVAPAADPPDSRSVSFSPQIEEIPAQPEAKVSFSPSVEEIPPPPLGPNNPDLKVSFSPEVETIPQQPPGPPENASSQAKGELQAQMIKPGEKLIELDEEGNNVNEQLVVPDDESEDDAQTRREMLEYHLNEVGNVVAQIDMEEAFGDNDDARSDFTSSEYMEEEDTPYTSGLGSDDEDDDYDDEDEHGRSKGAVVTDEMKKEMQELQQRLIGNLGPHPREQEVEDAVPDFDPQEFRKLVIRDNGSSDEKPVSQDTGKKAAQKKQVSFSDELDVAQPEVPNLSPEPEAAAEPVSDIVPERKSLEPTATASVSAPKPARPSRFKAERSRATNEEEAPAAGEGPILADSLVERPAAAPTHAPSTDSHDPLLARRELAADYYRRRNEMVREQGGFKVPTGNEDEGIGELMEERDGKVKKVSRFKAARIGGGSGGS
ncbi:hypothetical protein MBLNU230_g2908t1 [Neophaeotheca triangularis]